MRPRLCRCRRFVLRACAALLFVVFVLLPAPALSQSSFSSRVSTGLISLFKLTEGQTATSAPSSAADSVSSAPFGSLTVNTAVASWSLAHVGLTTSNYTAAGTPPRPVVSTLTNAAVLSNNYTLELWMRPASAARIIGVVAGIGDYGAVSALPSCPTSPTLAIFQQLAIMQVLLPLSVSSCSPFFSSGAVSLNHTAPNHVVVSVATNGASLYVNSVEMGNIALATTATAGYLYLAPSFTSSAVNFTNTWPGVIYMAAFYNKSLSAAQVATNFQAWLPNSVPYSASSAVTVPENTLTNFSLNATDFDVQHGHGAGQNLSFRVTSLPALGTLYYYNLTAVALGLAAPASPSAYQQITNALLPFAIRK